MRLKAYLENLGVPVSLVSMDNFFLPLNKRPPEASDWESPLCVDRERLADCILRLAAGGDVNSCETMGDAALFLASDMSGCMNSQVLNLRGFNRW